MRDGAFRRPVTWYVIISLLVISLSVVLVGLGVRRNSRKIDNRPTPEPGPTLVVSISPSPLASPSPSPTVIEGRTRTVFVTASPVRTTASPTPRPTRKPHPKPSPKPSPTRTPCRVPVPNSPIC